jgi:hypothetical protein
MQAKYTLVVEDAHNKRGIALKKYPTPQCIGLQLNNYMDTLERWFSMLLFSRLILKRVFTSHFVMHPRYEAFGGVHGKME